MGSFLVKKSKYLDFLAALQKKIEHNWYDEQIDLYNNKLKDPNKISRRLNLKSKNKKKNLNIKIDIIEKPEKNYCNLKKCFT
jgi:uncharacterized protein (DUF2461 family)